MALRAIADESESVILEVFLRASGLVVCALEIPGHRGVTHQELAPRPIRTLCVEMLAATGLTHR